MEIYFNHEIMKDKERNRIKIEKSLLQIKKLVDETQLLRDIYLEGKIVCSIPQNIIFYYYITLSISDKKKLIELKLKDEISKQELIELENATEGLLKTQGILCRCFHILMTLHFSYLFFTCQR